MADRFLYHFSEDPTIERFVPRPPLAHPDTEPLVWAIDEWHAPLYYVPRDCPRVCFWPLETSSQADIDRYFAYVTDRMVVAIEARWLDRLRTTALYRYALPEEPFASLDDAGMHVSRQPVTPLRVQPLGDLLDRFIEARVELRVCHSISALGQAVMGSTLHYSLIRMRNAWDWTGPVGKPAVPRATG